MRSLAISGLLLLSACTGASYLRTTSECPSGYVPIHTGGGQYAGRAMSAAGVVIGIRERRNEPEGSLDFWVKVVKKDLTEGRGYAFRSEEELEGARGLLFTVPEVKDTDYYLVLRVTPAQITTIEISGPKAEMEKDLGMLKDWITALRLQ